MELKDKKGEPVVASSSVADEILKFKNLMDMGAITQEEFNLKKKELLGLYKNSHTRGIRQI